MYVFDVLGLAEQRGLGFTTVRELSDKGLPLPQVTFDNPYIVFTLPRNDKAASFGRLEGLSPEERRGYEMLLKSGEPWSRAEYQEKMNLSQRTAQRHLTMFAEMKLVTIEGQGKNTRYKARS